VSAADRHGAFCWAGLASSNPDAVHPFYARLFGWEIQERDGYALFRIRGSDAALLYPQTVEAREAGAAPHWTCFISVDDAVATSALATELGGRAVFREPFDVDGQGRVAAIQDPVGALVSLWEPHRRSGATVLNVPGALCCCELVTSDHEQSAAFYGRLFDWPGDPRGQVDVCIRESPGRAVWRPYFRVESVEDAARTASAHGGRPRSAVIRSPGGLAQVLADPEEAQFGVLERSR
jgi:uncharacterized protein